ncbi:alpha/beta fold hydrolase [Ketogulonicigenium vulgare]|uniref:alpha/beta fold hydrolase n=1 Tax=Ketogulonicigenium vulgare TaxID=92945 RepID=UPI002359FFE6|nr:alpha/beta fold hydrolase [Ketogulonicigenium vulgare]
MLNTITHGEPGTRRPILIAHGLFGSGRNWGVIARRLAAEGRQVIAVDMRNHGSSPWYPDHNYFAMAQDLAQVIEDKLGSRADVIGHSMGGKAAMMLALTRPELVDRLVVADIAPVTYGHSHIASINAMQAVDLDAVSTRAEAAAALGMDSDTTGLLLQSLDLPHKRWKLNLETLGREIRTISGFPQTGLTYGGHTLFLRGALSDYVLPEHRDTIRALFTRPHFAKLPGAGHWLQAEKPTEFFNAVSAFLCKDFEPATQPAPAMA